MDKRFYKHWEETPKQINPTGLMMQCYTRSTQVYTDAAPTGLELFGTNAPT